MANNVGSDFTSELDEKIEKRVARCAGCKTPLEDHHWGIPCRFCEGFEKCSPKRGKKTDGEVLPEQPVINGDDSGLEALADELKALEIEERVLRKRKEEETLRQRIVEKRKVIEELRQVASRPASLHHDGVARSSFTTAELRKMDLTSGQDKTLPLDNVLRTIDPAQDQQLPFTWFQQETPVGSNIRPWQENHRTSTEMFLKPSKMAKGEKPLLIIDFVYNIVPQDEEETLGNQGNAKIVVT